MRRYGLTNLLAVAAVGLATLLAGATKAEAGFTIVLQSVTGSPGDYTWNYSAQTTTEDTIVNGSFFRIYDFYGYVAGSITAPAGWTASTALSNPVPPPNVILDKGDDASVPNLIFTYTGANIPGPTTIFNFTAKSVQPLSVVTFKNFAGRTQNSNNQTNVDSVGDVRVPAVPEPTSLISTSLGAIALGLFYARRRKQSA